MPKALDKLKELILISSLVLLFAIIGYASGFSLFVGLHSVFLSRILTITIVIIMFGFLFISFRYRFILFMGLIFMIFILLLQQPFSKYWYYRNLNIATVQSSASISLTDDVDGYIMHNYWLNENAEGEFQNNAGERFYTIPVLPMEKSNSIAPIKVFMAYKLPAHNYNAHFEWDKKGYYAMRIPAGENSFLYAAQNGQAKNPYKISSYPVFLTWQNIEEEQRKSNRLFSILMILSLLFWTVFAAICIVPAALARNIEKKDEIYWNRKKFDR